MKKRIVFVHNKLVVGGAEQVLLRLLNCFDYSRYHVTLVLTGGRDVLDSKLPKEVEIRYIISESWKYYLKHFMWKDLLLTSYYRFKKRKAKTEEMQHFWQLKAQNPYKGRANCVICWHPSISTMREAEIIKSKKKAVWIHGMFPVGTNLEKTHHALLSFDRIVCVSEGTKAYLLNVFPELSSRTETIYNIVNVNDIREAAQEPLPIEMKHPSIVTVGRISPEKGMQMIPEVLSNLLRLGKRVYWYIIGDGPTRPEIELMSKQYALDGYLFFLGLQSNPMPFIANCDIYVQPSYREGYCTTTNEARILHKPVIATDVSGMREQFVDGENAILVDPTSESLTCAISKLLDLPSLMTAFSERLKTVKIDNDLQLARIYSIIEKQ